MPLVSVIMPCHNAAATVAQTIESVQAQTLSDWELICVDDGSTDATRETLHAFAAEDARIIVIAQPNAGPSHARNVGAAAGHGRILAFLDADDLWLPGKLAAVVRMFNDDPRADAVFGGTIFFDGATGTETARATPRAGALTLGACLGENPLCTLSNLSVLADGFRVIGGFDERLARSEDLAWLVGAVLHGARIVGSPEPHIRYRSSLDGLSSDLDAMHAGWRRAIACARGDVHALTLRQAEARHLRYLARRALRIGQPAAIARGFAIRGLRLSPRAFLGDRHRGAATLVACLAAPFLPISLRRRAFA